MKIGKSIRFLRKQKGWTQNHLAELTFTSKANISNLENGNQGYSPALLESLSQAFDCPVSHIFILAEQLANTENISEAPIESLPIEVLFLQLSPEVKTSMKKLLIDIINSRS